MLEAAKEDEAYDEIAMESRVKGLVDEEGTNLSMIKCTW